MYFTVAYRYIMTSLNMKPNEGVYVLTDYVLEQIYGEKSPAKYSSEETSSESSESDEFKFPIDKKNKLNQQWLKEWKIERQNVRFIDIRIFNWSNISSSICILYLYNICFH